MQLRERAPGLVPILIAGCATVLLAIAARPAEAPRWRCGTTMVVVPAVPSFERDVPPPAVRDVVEIEVHGIPRADGLYRMRRFDEAARVARAAAEHDPELASLAELYAQAARVWDALPGVELQAQMREVLLAAGVFEHVRALRTLDTVLGAAYSAELDVKLAVLAPQAAAEYLRSRRYGDGATALATADALGVTGPAIDRLHAELARHRAETF